MSMFCSTDRCNEENEIIVGTSTNCSALRVRRRGKRFGTRSREIFGTLITGSAPASTSNCCMNSTTCSSPICGTGISWICTKGEKIHEVRPGVPQDPRLWPDLIEPVRPGGKHIPHVVVQVEVHRACRPGGRSRLARGKVHLALLPPLLLAIVGLRGAVWCVNSARAIATLRRSWRRNCLSRRSRRLRAAPAA